MSDITFVFRSAPHSSSAGREGLDALLAASAYSEDLSALFIDDGVAQLLASQDTSAILSKNYVPMFKLLELYDIEKVFVCRESLTRLGLEPSQLIIDAELLTHTQLTQLLHNSAKLLSF